MNIRLFHKHRVVAGLTKILSAKDGNVFLIVFIISCIYSLWALSIGWNNPILDQHSFRQTQTAISAYYLIQGSPWLAYETPVLGFPWSIPFEFPLYQWLVAIIVKMFHSPLEQTGRLVSAFFFYLSLIPSYIILGYLNIPRRYRWVFLSLFVASPLYLFWSRTFMIESTAFFLGLAYLAAVGSYFRRKALLSLSFAIVFGILGALVKITTFAGFVVAAGFFALKNFRHSRKNRSDVFLTLIIPLLALVLLPYIAVSIWTHFTDSHKLLNPMAADFITSKALTNWNFGTWEQRYSLLILQTVGRALTELFGGWIFSIIVLVLLPLFGKRKPLYLTSICLFVVVLITFTNLHIVHNYYQYANGIFLIAAIGFGLLGLLEREGIWKLLGCGIFALVLVFQTRAYLTDWTSIISQNTGLQILITSAEIEKHTNPKDVVLIDGLDWSPELPFYSHRRALMRRDEKMPLPNESKMKVALDLLSGAGYRLGTLVFCDKKKLDSQGIVRITAAYNFEKNPVYSDSFCQVHLPLDN